MSTKSNIDTLEEKLGYAFLDRALLKQAMTHNSVGAVNHEELKIYGAKLLDAVLVKELQDQSPGIKKGEITQVISDVFNKENLSNIGRNMGIDQHILLAYGTGHMRSDRVASFLKAVVAAIFEDSSANFEVIRAFVRRLVPLSEALARVGRETKVFSMQEEDDQISTASSFADLRLD